jgi:glycosyltransferase involved in cell wall biosynthesis
MVGSEFPPISGGTGYYIYNLSKKLVKRGYKVTVLTRGENKKTYHEELDGISVYRVRFIPVFPFHLQIHGIFINRLLRSLESDFDLLHLHNSNIPVVYTRLPTVVTVHGTMKRYLKNRKASDLISLVIKAFSNMYISIDSKVIGSADRVIAVSAACANELQEYYGVKDSEVIHNGVNTALFIPAGEEKEPTEPYVLYTGRLSPEKGLFDLLESAKRVCGCMPQIKYIIIGKGPLETRLRKLVNTMNLNGNVSFKGYMDQKNLLKYYQNALLNVLTSYSEGFATTLLEAMSVGIPTVATNIPANSEAVVDNETGLLVPKNNPESLANAIMTLLKDEKLRKKMGHNARKRALEHFDWDIITDRIVKIYSGVKA